MFSIPMAKSLTTSPLFFSCLDLDLDVLICWTGMSAQVLSAANTSFSVGAVIIDFDIDPSAPYKCQTFPSLHGIFCQVTNVTVGDYDTQT